MLCFQPRKRIWSPMLNVQSFLHHRSVLYAASICVPIVSLITQSNAIKTCTGVISWNPWRLFRAPCSVLVGGHN